MFYIVTMMTIKIALGVFFLRIFTAQYMLWTVKVIMAISSIFGVVYLFSVIFQCGAPINGPTFWVKILSNQCESKEFIYGLVYTHSTIMAVTDMIFVLLPYLLIRGSSKPRREKMVIGGILMLGAMQVITAAVFHWQMLTPPTAAVSPP